MWEIQASISKEDILCAEVAAPPTAMVVFGASGDLTSRKLLPSLMQIFQRQLLDDRFYLLGTGRKNFSDQQFRKIAQQAIKERCKNISVEESKLFFEKLYYISGDYGDIAFYENIKTRLGELDKKYKVAGSHIFYLAVPPFLYPVIVVHLGSAGLSCPCDISL